MHRANNRPWLVVVEVADLIRLLDVVDAHRAKSGEPVDGGAVGRLDGAAVGRLDGAAVGRSDGAVLAKTGTPDGGGN
jgi:outer membrane lipoprotein SlyB